MSHNIQTYRNHAISTNGSVGSDDAVPTSNSLRDRPILHIQDDELGGSVEFLFRGASDFGSGYAGVVVNPWTDNSTAITGEDLFALRELLNELPEEAFVRPADPVVEWADGDQIVEVGEVHSWLYTRKNGRWQHSDGMGTDLTDSEFIGKYVSQSGLPDRHTYIVLRKLGVVHTQNA